MITSRLIVHAAIAAVATAVAAPAIAQQTYVLTDIGPYVESVGGVNLHINASGQICGTTQFGPVLGVDTAFVWTPAAANGTTGTFAWLPVPSGTKQYWAQCINSSGQIVGKREYPSGTYKYQGKTYVKYAYAAVEWQANGTETDLPAAFGTEAYGINDAGEIVGCTSLLVNGNTYPLPGYRAFSINKSGLVAGNYDSNCATGYLWTPAQPNGTSGSYVTLPFWPSQVDDLGQVVGCWACGGTPALFSMSGGTKYLAPQGTSGYTYGLIT